MPPPGVVVPPPPSHSQVGGVRADFGIRLASWLLDGVLYGLLATAFIVPGIVLSISAFSGCFADQSRNVSSEVTEWEPNAYCPPGAISGTAIAGGIALIVCGVLVSILLYVGAMGKTGQPWGARITHIKVVDEQTGAPIGFGRALGRSLFANFISMSVFHLGFLWISGTTSSRPGTTRWSNPSWCAADATQYVDRAEDDVAHVPGRVASRSTDTGAVGKLRSQSLQQYLSAQLASMVATHADCCTADTDLPTATRPRTRDWHRCTT